ncbi:MAG: DeoR/GlpR family DNA-binding transcription regulator [Dermatophilaceae bacterium]
MLASQRHARILERVNALGAVRVADLVTELGVSDMTVRRDIEHLARRDLLERVHGGAVAAGDHAELSRTQPSADEPGFAAKSHLMQRAKAAIAREAATLVEPGAAIALSAGTTTVALARELRAIPGLTIVTNSVPAAQALAGSASAAGHTVVLTGGTRTPSEALVGPIAVQALRGLHVDLVFLGVHGLDLKAGLTTPNLVEAETNRALIQSGRSLCVVADHTKWGIVGLGTIVGLDAVATLVTDAGLPADARASVADVVGRLVVTDVPAQLVTTSSGPVA